MHRDGFGCLHTEDISGREIEGLPFLQKTPAVAHMPARCERKFGGNPPGVYEVKEGKGRAEITTKNLKYQKN